jgi:hypothetical protein
MRCPAIDEAGRKEEKAERFRRLVQSPNHTGT